ncbi:MAG: Ppx/GppA family phosphatase [Alphaproteobacteria bacterium]|nr:Ppx/GppA family phosphatase [Alphaproteobacteria bacterium]
MPHVFKKGNKLPFLRKKEKDIEHYAAIDLGTNSCRLVIATPTPTSFHVVETFSKITRLGEGIIKDNQLSKAAMRRTVNSLKVCKSVMDEYAPITHSRFVATAACRRAKNIDEFLNMVHKEAGLNLEIISSKEEARLAVVGCLPLLNRNIKRALIFDIGGGSTEISLARVTEEGKTFIEGFVSLPYGVVTISEAFPKQEMTNLAYNTIIERTEGILTEFDAKYHIYEAIENQEIQVIGTSGTVTVLGAVHLGLPRYNRSAVDGLSLSGVDVENVINKIKTMGDSGRRKHRCIGPSKADLTISGCAIIEALLKTFPISEITIADRGIREGILLDMIRHTKHQQKHFKKHFRRHPYFKRKKDEKKYSMH